MSAATEAKAAAAILYFATLSPGDDTPCVWGGCLVPAVVRLSIGEAAAGDYCGRHFTDMRVSAHAHGHEVADRTGDLSEVMTAFPGWRFGNLADGRLAAYHPIEPRGELVVVAWLLGQLRQKVRETSDDNRWNGEC